MPGEANPPTLPSAPSSAGGRWAFGVRLLVLGAVALAAVGFTDHYSHFPLLTAALGPTLYVFVAHPTSSTARLRNAAVGHAVAVVVGLASLASFGLWRSPSIASRGHASVEQAAATAVAVGLTLLLLHVLHSHHAPAASTVILIATGLARPWAPLLGLVTGLAAIVLLGSLLARAPFPRHAGQLADQP